MNRALSGFIPSGKISFSNFCFLKNSREILVTANIKIERNQTFILQVSYYLCCDSPIYSFPTTCFYFFFLMNNNIVQLQLIIRLCILSGEYLLKNCLYALLMKKKLYWHNKIFRFFYNDTKSFSKNSDSFMISLYLMKFLASSDQSI